ncbi:carotenoid oxygenase family protein [Umezawaea tangerina]|uniref:Dioxygenase n=1 Tax=Umezawaea tangerina TaxID=84725 RepID=A0A2T0SXD1_9PSEU|nr:carotenoid oxygenase family protein [Umezawaea tangerina]PRY38076.1 carotenoid cleavage dioxygenase-like enzyme [Umezawaea tangerina]
MSGVEDGVVDGVPAPVLPVEGTVPKWLTGTLLRTGPATSPSAFRNWLGGPSALHRFGFGGGRVSYRTGLLDSRTTRRGHGRIDFAEFTVDPCLALFSRFFTRYRVTPNAAANVLSLADRQWARHETPIAVDFEPGVLDGVGISGGLDPVAPGARPHHAPLTGDVLDYVLSFGERSEYRVHRRRPGGRVRDLLVAIPTEHPGYLHSFAVTDRFVVLVEYPFVADPRHPLAPGRPFIANHRWRPDLGTRFIVVDQADGRIVADHRTEAFFAFHHINARDAGHRVVLDICTYANADAVNAPRPARWRGELPLALPTRYEIDLLGGVLHTRRLAAQAFELPRISYRAHNGGDYRFAYGVGVPGPRGADVFDRLVKLDVQSGETSIWHEPGGHPGEPVFVPSPTARHEDDGVLLSVVLDGRDGHAGMVVLDAHSFEELARVAVPHLGGTATVHTAAS